MRPPRHARSRILASGGQSLATHPPCAAHGLHGPGDSCSCPTCRAYRDAPVSRLVVCTSTSATFAPRRTRRKPVADDVASAELGRTGICRAGGRCVNRAWLAPTRAATRPPGETGRHYQRPLVLSDVDGAVGSPGVRVSRGTNATRDLRPQNPLARCDHGAGRTIVGCGSGPGNLSWEAVRVRANPDTARFSASFHVEHRWSRTTAP